MWTPNSPGAYAGTCIFLVLLAVIFRSLLAVKAWKERAWLDAEFNRRYVTVAGKLPKSERISQDSDSKRMVLSENGVEEDVMVVKKRGMGVRPWRITTDPVRAVMDTVIVGVGYLLMLAIMTMNMGTSCQFSEEHSWAVSRWDDTLRTSTSDRNIMITMNELAFGYCSGSCWWCRRSLQACGLHKVFNDNLSILRSK